MLGPSKFDWLEGKPFFCVGKQAPCKQGHWNACSVKSSSCWKAKTFCFETLEKPIGWGNLPKGWTCCLLAFKYLLRLPAKASQHGWKRKPLFKNPTFRTWVKNQKNLKKNKLQVLGYPKRISLKKPQVLGKNRPKPLVSKAFWGARWLCLRSAPRNSSRVVLRTFCCEWLSTWKRSSTKCGMRFRWQRGWIFLIFLMFFFLLTLKLTWIELFRDCFCFSRLVAANPSFVSPGFSIGRALGGQALARGMICGLPGNSPQQEENKTKNKRNKSGPPTSDLQIVTITLKDWQIDCLMLPQTLLIYNSKSLCTLIFVGVKDPIKWVAVLIHIFIPSSRRSRRANKKLPFVHALAFSQVL